MLPKNITALFIAQSSGLCLQESINVVSARGAQRPRYGNY
jgi:hypothetical protein